MIGKILDTCLAAEDWLLQISLTFVCASRLEKVEAGSNWLFPFDQISPIEI
jgi:hypothetical protein